MSDSVSPHDAAAMSPSSETATGGRVRTTAKAGRTGPGPRWRSPRWGRAAGWCTRRPVLAAAVVYAVLSLIMVGQGLLPGRTLSSSDYLWSAAPWTASKPPGVRPLGANYELADAVSAFQPFMRYTRAMSPHVPLWNPYIMAGRPLMADGQSAVFSPFSFPAYVMPFWRSLAVIAVLKLFVAAFGTFLFARALGMRFGGALFSGVVYAFGTFFVVWLAWPLTNIFPLIPWILLLTELLVRRPGPLPVVGLAGLVALQYFGGHPETSFHTLFVATVFFAFRTLLAWRRGRGGPGQLVRPTLAFVLALVAGTALAAVFILPFLELLLHSADIHHRLGSAPSHADSRYLFAVFLPDYWGRPTQTVIEPFVSNRGYYAGALTLMLAGAALILRPTIERLAVAAFAVFSLVMVLGATVVFRAVTHLPGFRTAHNGRMVIFILLCLALLAGWGLDELSTRRATGTVRRWLVMGASAVIFCLPIVWMAGKGTLDLHVFGSALNVAWGFAHPPPVSWSLTSKAQSAAPIIRLSSLLEWLPLAGAGLALVVLRLRARPRLGVSAFVTLAVAFIVVDLFRANMGFNPAIPVQHAQPPATAAIRYLQARRPTRFVGLDTKTPAAPIPADQAMNYGLYDARGYDYPVENRFDHLWRTQVAPPVPDFVGPTTLVEPTPKALRALSLLSVASVVQDPAEKPLHRVGLRLAYSGRDARVYDNERGLPRAFLVDQQQTVRGGAAALAAVTAPGFDARRTVVTERALAGLPPAVPNAGASPPARARLVSYKPERVAAEATASRRSLLVLTDTYFPGWKARVDGRPAPVVRVDYLLRGVEVPPGTHRVEFRYEPESWRIGWIVSLLAFVSLVFAAVVGWRVRRRGQQSV